MQEFSANGVTIGYEVLGSGPPVLLIAPGGFESNISKWSMSPWNPVERLAAEFTVIAMDQRNSGASSAPVDAGDDWDVHMADQLGLLDHLGFERSHFLGMCIGGPYIANIMKNHPDRVLSSVLLQPVGIDDSNRPDFYAFSQVFVDRLKASTHPDVPDQTWNAYITAMWGGDFLLTATRDDVQAMQSPMLILMGDDNFHPEWTSREMAELAPNATLIEQWKDPALTEAIHAQIVAFLHQHS